jgi:hypothetical protein
MTDITAKIRRRWITPPIAWKTNGPMAHSTTNAIASVKNMGSPFGKHGSAFHRAQSRDALINRICYAKVLRKWIAAIA